VWQPTLTLWRPDESAAIISEFIGGTDGSPSLPARLSKRCARKTQTATALPATLANPLEFSREPTPRRRRKPMAQDLARRQFTGADLLLLCRIPFCQARRLYRPALGGIGGFGFFSPAFLRAGHAPSRRRPCGISPSRLQATLRYSVAQAASHLVRPRPRRSAVTRHRRSSSAILTCMPGCRTHKHRRRVIPTGDYQLRLVRGGTELVVDGANRHRSQQKCRAGFGSQSAGSSAAAQ